MFLLNAGTRLKSIRRGPPQKGAIHTGVTRICLPSKAVQGTTAGLRHSIRLSAPDSLCWKFSNIIYQIQRLGFCCLLFLLFIHSLLSVKILLFLKESLIFLLGLFFLSVLKLAFLFSECCYLRLLLTEFHGIVVEEIQRRSINYRRTQVRNAVLRES
jgi:hypothetical protein